MYQGHKSKPAWNVALYLFNDYGLYTMMREQVKAAPTLEVAADNIVDELRQNGVEHTPDGYRFTRTSVRLALQHWEG